jgi:hypothetical protein
VATVAAEVAVLTREARWPAGSERGWRCQIVWRESEFRALLLAPGTRMPAATGSPGDPTPSRWTELESLAETLEEEGWTAVKSGQRWYALRYVWTHAPPPPGTERTHP